MSWIRQVRKWLLGPLEQRGARRSPGAGMFVHYWTGGAPAPCKISNISPMGAYIEGVDHWFPGTVISLTFQIGPQRPAGTPDGVNGSVSGLATSSAMGISATVVRREVQGFAVLFLFQDSRQKTRFHQFVHEALASRGCDFAGGGHRQEERRPGWKVAHA